MSKLQDYSSTNATHTEQSRQYEDALYIVKMQVDLIVNSNNSTHAWLNEVQAYINRARDVSSCQQWNQQRDFYDE